MPKEVFDCWYNWSDLDVLETLLHSCYSPNFLVVEIATGPNIAVPHILKNIALPFRYISLDVNKAHIKLQKEGVGTSNVQGVVGDAIHIPFHNESVDMIVFHHAVDDILETRGVEGVKSSIEDALRTLKPEGCMIFSHSIFANDPYTFNIDLLDVQTFLEKRITGRFIRIKGFRQKWLIVEDIHITRH